MKETQVSSNIRQEIKHLKLNWHFTNLCNMHFIQHYVCNYRIIIAHHLKTPNAFKHNLSQHAH